MSAALDIATDMGFSVNSMCPSSSKRRALGRFAHLLVLGASLLLSPGLSRAEVPRTPVLRTQLDVERHAVRLVARPDIQEALRSLEVEWHDKSPGLLPETYGQIHDSIEEVVFMVALEVIDGDPRRPEVIELSAPPHHWFGADVPGGRWGIRAAPLTRPFPSPTPGASLPTLEPTRTA